MPLNRDEILMRQATVLFEHQQELNNFDGNNIITPIQEENAISIYNSFKTNEKNIITLAISPPQSGKTGVINYLCYLFVKNNDINCRDILIFTGLSSVDWVSQTQDRFPSIMKENIFHRNTIKKFEEKIKQTNNLLIIIDEIHIATSINQTMSLFFKNNGLLDINNLQKRNIKIVEVSATPDNILTDINGWNSNNFSIVNFKVPKEYIGMDKLLNNGQLYPNENMTHISIVHNLKEFITLTYKNKPYYHIIRINTKKDVKDITLKNILSVFNDYQIIYFCDNSKEDINKLYLNNKPTKPSIIIIKEKLRIAYTISKQYVGVLYERKTDCSSCSTCIQSLVGRACGYTKSNHLSIFTDISIVKKYIKIINSGFQLGFPHTQVMNTTINAPKIVYSSIHKKEEVVIDKKCNVIKVSLTQNEFNRVRINKGKYDAIYLKNILEFKYTNAFNYVENKKIKFYCPIELKKKYNNIQGAINCYNNNTYIKPLKYFHEDNKELITGVLLDILKFEIYLIKNNWE